MNVLKINGTALSSEQLVSWLKLTGRFSSVINDMVQEKLTAVAARKQGLAVSDDDLQEAVENHRRIHGLFRVADANEFLDAAGASLEDYENFIEDGLLAAKLLDDVASETAVTAHFQGNKPDYESVEIGHIVVDSESKAREVMALIQEGAASFQDMAREISLVETATNGGQIGKIFRGTLADDLEAKVFAAKANDVLGPVALEDGNFEIFSVFERHDAALDEDTRNTIRQRLSGEWFQSAAREYGVEV
ncbi:MAG: peptidylprolyl isomerase [Pseudomonadales bacterium]